MIEVISFFVGFLIMEPITYLSHRYIFHGFGLRIHQSHHAYEQKSFKGFEFNDFYPGISALLTMSIIALGIFVPSLHILKSFGFGVTLYGMSYFFIHDLVIHERLSFIRMKPDTFPWHYHAHRIHHAFGGEPYGLLFPIVPKQLKERYFRSIKQK